MNAIAASRTGRGDGRPAQQPLALERAPGLGHRSLPPPTPSDARAHTRLPEAFAKDSPKNVPAPPPSSAPALPQPLPRSPPQPSLRPPSALPLPTSLSHALARKRPPAGLLLDKLHARPRDQRGSLGSHARVRRGLLHRDARLAGRQRGKHNHLVGRRAVHARAGAQRRESLMRRPSAQSLGRHAAGAQAGPAQHAPRRRADRHGDAGGVAPGTGRGRARASPAAAPRGAPPRPAVDASLDADHARVDASGGPAPIADALAAAADLDAAHTAAADLDAAPTAAAARGARRPVLDYLHGERRAGQRQGHEGIQRTLERRSAGSRTTAPPAPTPTSNPTSTASGTAPGTPERSGFEDL